MRSHPGPAAVDRAADVDQNASETHPYHTTSGGASAAAAAVAVDVAADGVVVDNVDAAASVKVVPNIAPGLGCEGDLDDCLRQVVLLGDRPWDVYPGTEGRKDGTDDASGG